MTHPLDELQAVAKKLTREALSGYPPIPEHARRLLTLGVQFDGEFRIFELYIPRDPPEQGIVLTRVRLNGASGHADAVEVYIDRWRELDSL
jgi:hypothetical protein